MKKFLIFWFLIASVGAFAQQQQQNNVVSVVGEGIVHVDPDKVVVRARVEHSGQSPTNVKKQNDEVVNTIFAYLKSQGIPSENIQTEYINLNKDYNYNTKEYSYSANQAISIQLNDLEKYEEIMSGLLESGLNRIDGIQFKSSRIEELKSEARKWAVLNAKSKAMEFAEALGQRIGKAVKIAEVGSNDFQPVFRAMEMQSDAAGSGGTTIAPGEMEISVKVNVDFQLY